MPDIPLPFPVKYSPRDASRARGSLVKNCFEGVDAAGQPYMEKRAGQILTANGAGSGQGVFTQGGQVYSIALDTLYSSPPRGNSGWTTVSTFFNTHAISTPVDFKGFIWWVDPFPGYYRLCKGDLAGNISVVATSGFPFSAYGTLIVFNGYLWYIDVVPSNLGNGLSTYRTSDGVTWTLMSTSSSMPGREHHTITQFNGSLYILGGSNHAGSIYYQDCWKADDGYTWVQVPVTTPYAGGNYGVSYSFRGGLWLYIASGYYVSYDGGQNWISKGAGTNYPSAGLAEINGLLWTFTNIIAPHQWGSTSDGFNWNTSYYAPDLYQHSFVLFQNRLLMYPNAVNTALYEFNPYLGSYGSDAVAAGKTTLAALSPSVAGQYFTFSQIPATSYNGFFFKSIKDAYVYNLDTSTLTKISDADYPATTVPGHVLLDGTYYVMTPAGQIYGSALNDPTSWTALNAISCVAEPDGGIALARLQNYIAAFGAYTTEFFYDAGNAPPGSPLLPVQNAMVEIGCAAGGSVAGIENTLFFIGVGKQRDRSVYVFNGTVPQKVSTSAIDTILFSDNLSGVVSYCCKIKGQGLYVLTLPTTGITLVYCLDTKAWYEWTSAVAGSPRILGVGALTYGNGQAIVVDPSHGYADASMLLVSGASDNGCNGFKTISFIDANTYSYPITTLSAGTATGNIATIGYTETYFTGIFASGMNTDLVTQSRLTGDIQVIDEGTYLDNTLPILSRLRSVGVEGGTTAKKYFSALTLIAESLASFAYLRTTKDDYRTWSAPRAVSLATERKRFNRLGAAYRQAFEILHCDNTNFHVDSILLTIDKGVD